MKSKGVCVMSVKSSLKTLVLFGTMAVGMFACGDEEKVDPINPSNGGTGTTTQNDTLKLAISTLKADLLRVTNVVGADSGKRTHFYQGYTFSSSEGLFDIGPNVGIDITIGFSNTENFTSAPDGRSYDAPQGQQGSMTIASPTGDPLYKGYKVLVVTFPHVNNNGESSVANYTTYTHNFEKAVPAGEIVSFQDIINETNIALTKPVGTYKGLSGTTNALAPSKLIK